MSKPVTTASDELTTLKKRIKKLAMEKSYNALIIRLMNRISTAPGLDNTVNALLKHIMDVIGGMNIKLYYQVEQDMHYADVYGKRKKLDTIDDALVKKVIDSRQPLEIEEPFSETRMTTPVFSKAYTWIFPLKVGPDLIGVIKMEKLHIAMQDLYKKLPTFFAYTALILKNEIMGHARLQEINTELEQVNRKLLRERVFLAAANEKLQELDRMKSMFIASMSHELRTPLNSIMGFTSVILDGLSGDITTMQKDQLNRVYRSSEHLLSLINDIIDISKIEAGKTKVITRDFFLHDMIAKAVESIWLDLQKKGLILEVNVSKKLKMHTDGKRLFQCVLNFLSNAVKFTESGTIKILAAEQGKIISISVSDTGIGIAKEDMARLFRPFERIDSNLSIKAGGTGLGLYLTKKMVAELLEGEIKVASDEGTGSTFTMRVPQNIKLSDKKGDPNVA